ncbi:MAG: hypothetical protein ACRC33_28935 [Gemmataceae bacterium]
MEPDNFERSLRGFVRRRPFASFTVHFVDGDSATVDHPEALVLRGGVAVYLSAGGEPTLFDHRSVSRLTKALDAASA